MEVEKSRGVVCVLRRAWRAGECSCCGFGLGRIGVQILQRTTLRHACLYGTRARDSSATGDCVSWVAAQQKDVADLEDQSVGPRCVWRTEKRLLVSETKGFLVEI